VLGLLSGMLGLSQEVYVIVVIAVSALLLVPWIAVGVRRMHDIGKSGWWLFINLVPFIGGIWYFVLTLFPSQESENEYGPVA